MARLDGNLSPMATHDMGAAFMLYAQGLLPFLLPPSVLLFEPDAKSRQRMQRKQTFSICPIDMTHMDHQAASIGIICPKGTGRVSVEAQRTG
jgi:hypothetical protein